MKISSSFAVSQLSCVRQQQTLFADLSFELKAGDALFIEGPNGAGKSSLLRILAGIATPGAGDVYWDNQSIQLDRVTFQEQMHFVGHTNGIKLGLTVGENVELMGRLGMDCFVVKSTPRNDETLLLLKLSGYKNTLAKHLSAGQRRRLALARLFLFPKQLWLLDEPLTALDAATQAVFLAQMENHLEQGGIVIASSHQPIVINHPAKSLRLPLC